MMIITARIMDKIYRNKKNRWKRQPVSVFTGRKVSLYGGAVSQSYSPVHNHTLHTDVQNIYHKYIQDTNTQHI